MSPNNPVFLLDSYAILAYLNGESGAARVKEILRLAQMLECQVLLCWINLGEVLYIVDRLRDLHHAQLVLALIESLPLKLLPVDPDLILEAAHIKAHNTISYADAFAVAAARQEQAVLLTGDPEFKAVETLVKIEWLS